MVLCCLYNSAGLPKRLLSAMSSNDVWVRSMKRSEAGHGVLFFDVTFAIVLSIGGEATACNRAGVNLGIARAGPVL